MVAPYGGDVGLPGSSSTIFGSMCWLALGPGFGSATFGSHFGCSGEGPIWFRLGSGFGSGVGWSRLVQTRFSFGFSFGWNVLQAWFRFGSDLVQRGFRFGSALLLMGRTGLVYSVQVWVTWFKLWPA